MKYNTCCNYKYVEPTGRVSYHEISVNQTFQKDENKDEELVKKKSKQGSEISHKSKEAERKESTKSNSLRKSKSFVMPKVSKRRLSEKILEKNTEIISGRKSSFDNIYTNPNNKFNIKGICNECLQRLEEEKHLDEWDEIRTIISHNYKKTSAKYLLFGNQPSDVESLISSGKINIKGKNYEEGMKNMSRMKDGCLIF